MRSRSPKPSYLGQNEQFWEAGYATSNVESHVFRAYGRIFVHDFGLDGSGGERLLDFGCGSGTAAAFFHGKGFEVYGVDVSEASIAMCRARLPERAEHFHTIGAAPRAGDRFSGHPFRVIVALQCLYYLSPGDLQVRMQTLYDQLEPGGTIYVSMMGSRHHYFTHSTPADGGMRRVELHTERLHVDAHYVTFMESEDQLVDTFRPFTPCHIGYYAEKYRSDEGEDFHYTFVGKKA